MVVRIIVTQPRVHPLPLNNVIQPQRVQFREQSLCCMLPITTKIQLVLGTCHF
jgi:hypothetical protein